jgi:hypothetical protein
MLYSAEWLFTDKVIVFLVIFFQCHFFGKFAVHLAQSYSCSLRGVCVSLSVFLVCQTVKCGLDRDVISRSTLGIR